VFSHTFIYFFSFFMFLSDPKTSKQFINLKVLACFWTAKKGSQKEAQKRTPKRDPKSYQNKAQNGAKMLQKKDPILSVFVVGYLPLSSFLSHSLSFSLFLCSRSLPFSLSPPPPPPPLSFLFSLSLSPSLSSLSLSLASLLVRFPF